MEISAINRQYNVPTKSQYGTYTDNTTTVPSESYSNYVQDEPKSSNMMGLVAMGLLAVAGIGYGIYCRREVSSLTEKLAEKTKSLDETAKKLAQETEKTATAEKALETANAQLEELKAAAQKAKEKAKDVAEKTKEKVKETSEKVKEGAEKVKKNFKEKWNNFWANLKSKFSKSSKKDAPKEA